MSVTIKSGEHLVIEIPVEEKLAYWLNRAKKAEAEILRLRVREGLINLMEPYGLAGATDHRNDIIKKLLNLEETRAF